MVNMTDSLRAFLDESMAHRPLEVKMVKKIVKALREAGTPVVAVWDTEEEEAVNTTQNVLDIVFNLDEAWLLTADRSWVRLSMGEGFDMICDYTVDLEEALKPVNEWVEARW